MNPPATRQQAYSRIADLLVVAAERRAAREAADTVGAGHGRPAPDGKAPQDGQPPHGTGRRGGS